MLKKQIYIIIFVFLYVLILMLSGCSALDDASVVQSDSSETTVGIIAALDYEVEILKENMQVEVEAGTEYYTGRIGNHNVVCMQCGMGKVSAALGAQAMITKYHPDIIINSGAAGAVAQGLEVGDMVIADSTVEWDLDTIGLGNPRGYVSALDKVEMTTDKKTADEIEEVIGDDSKVYRGMIASGDQFVCSDEQRDLILEAFPDALCVEMEGGAIGHVCEQNGIPFCVIRCMSDNADRNSGVDFAEFAPVAGEKSAGYILDYLEKY